MMKKDATKEYLQFADNLFAGTTKQEKRENILISPYSMYSLLSMLCEGTNLGTREEITSALIGRGSDKEYYGALCDIAAKFEDSGAAKLHEADACIVKEEKRPYILNDYVRIIDDLYSAPVLSSADIVGTVNAWVAKETKGMISELLRPGDDPDLCLINAIAFVAKWQEKYKPHNIEEGCIFTNESGEEEEVTMLNSTEHTWLHSKKLVGFAKPYMGEKYDFVALIPESTDDDINEMLPSVSDISRMHRSGTVIKTVVSMPEFTFDFSLEMNDVLQGMGIVSVFNPSKADLSFMTDKPGSYVDAVLHKTHIENNSEGTKAAAISAAEIFVGCAPHFDEMKLINLDRPFAFAIVHKESSLPLFVGVLNSIKEVK